MPTEEEKQSISSNLIQHEIARLSAEVTPLRILRAFHLGNETLKEELTKLHVRIAKLESFL